MRARSLPVLAAALLAAVVGMTLATRTGSAQETSRYPYDPACPWGRVSNGKGMLVRCITRTESLALASAKTAPTAAPPSTASPPPAAASAPPPPPKPPAGASLSNLTVTADEGALPAATKSLKTAQARYEECVTKNGGLEKPEGQVRVRFLVRPRGRAEGVSVSQRSGLSLEAAECVAHVVDRRWVGTPQAPLVGATAIFKFGRVDK